MQPLIHFGLALVMGVGFVGLGVGSPTGPAVAQQGAWQDGPAPRGARRNDAYRPNGSESGGLGTLDERDPLDPQRDYARRDPGDPGAYQGGPQAGYGAPPPYQPQYGAYRGSAAPPPPYRDSYGTGPDSYRGPPRGGDAYGGGYASNNPGFGQPYTPPDEGAYDTRNGNRPYMSGEGPPPYRAERAERRDGSFSADEITRAGHGFFGSISQGLASVIEHTYRNKGRPNGYILGEEGGGAWIAGLRYGQGTLYTKDAGSFPVYWQGPSIGFDVGAAGSKTMILVYNLRDPSDVFDRFGGVDGSAYVVGGVGVTFLTRQHVTMAPIRSGVGLRIGANIGYLKFSDRPTWNPF